MEENVLGLLGERDRLMRQCERLGCVVFPSAANFFLGSRPAVRLVVRASRLPVQPGRLHHRCRQPGFTRNCSKGTASSCGGSPAGRAWSTCCGLRPARRNRTTFFWPPFRNSCHERCIPRSRRHAALGTAGDGADRQSGQVSALAGRGRGACRAAASRLRAGRGQQPGRARHAGLSPSRVRGRAGRTRGPIGHTRRHARRTVFICPHLPADQCACRKPRTGLVDEYLRARGGGFGRFADDRGPRYG